MSDDNASESMTQKDGIMVLPDGSACFTASYPLPKTHWIYQTDEYGYSGNPPMTLRMYAGQMRNELSEKVREAAKYAIKAATRCGKDEDFDPDALIQNLIVGLFGYHTVDGLSGEDWDTPKPPPLAYEVTLQEIKIQSLDILTKDNKNE